MAQEINLGGTIYISSKRAAEITGYTQDYVGQLARTSVIEAKRVSGLWYVLEDSIRKHKEKADEYTPQPPRLKQAQESEVSISLDGKDYISTKRAAKITGYSQDYVGQLARSGQILSRQVGNRWYVDREAILKHKEEKDSMLAAVQREAVGLAKSESRVSTPITSDDIIISESRDTYFKYISEDNDPIPVFLEEKGSSKEDRKSVSEWALYENEAPEEVRRQIPIRLVSDTVPNLTPIPSSSKLRNARKWRKVVIIVVASCIILILIRTTSIFSYLDPSGASFTQQGPEESRKSLVEKGKIRFYGIVQGTFSDALSVALELFSKEFIYRQ